jgi:PAS domain S-box-containing protein
MTDDSGRLVMHYLPSLAVVGLVAVCGLGAWLVDALALALRDGLPLWRAVLLPPPAEVASRLLTVALIALPASLLAGWRGRVSARAAEADRLRAILDSLDAGVYVADMRTYEILYANAPLVETMGEVVGKTCWRLLQQGQTGPCPFCTNRYLVDGDGRPTGVHTWELRNTRNGRWYDIRDRAVTWEDGRLVRLEIATDISERKRVEHALHLERDRAQQYLDLAEVMLVALDPRARVTLINRKGCEILGYGEEELLGQDWFDLILPGELGRSMRPVFDRAMAGELEPATAFEHEVHVKGGGRRTVAWHNALLHDLEGRVVGVLSCGEDVTEQREAEAALHVAYREMEQRVAARTAELAEANRELEAFSYTVSHDLRAPLRTVMGFSEALAEELGEALPAGARDHLGRIQAAGARMSQLIDDLLVLSRLTRAELHPGRVDLSALAGEVIAELRGADPGRRVDMDIQADLWAHGDRILLRAVLENLLGNAWKYTARRESAHIALGREDGAFYVRDDGAGFDMRYVARLFKPFQRLHGADEYEGTGIGLATVQRVIARHGGRVWAQGRVGEGATFYFTLPQGGAGREAA